MRFEIHFGFRQHGPSGLLLLLLGFLVVSAGVQAADPEGDITSRGSDSPTRVEQRLRVELRVLLMDMVQSGDFLDSSGAPFSLIVESPVERSADLGVLVDTRDGSVAKRGLLVLGTTPGGLASRIGFRNGDVIVSLNDRSLVGLGSSTDGSAQAGRVLRETLASLEEGAPLTFTVLREGKSLSLVGSMHSVLIPPFSLRLGAAASASVEPVVSAEKPVTGKACGWINTFDNAPRQEHFHAAILISIDGEHTPLQGPSSYRVTAGKHVLKIGEAIEQRYLAFSQRFRDSGGGDRYKTLEVDVAPNTAYFLAARLNADLRNEWRDGKFWDPVVWSTKQESCR